MGLFKSFKDRRIAKKYLIFVGTNEINRLRILENDFGTYYVDIAIHLPNVDSALDFYKKTNMEIDESESIIYKIREWIKSIFTDNELKTDAFYFNQMAMRLSKLSSDIKLTELSIYFEKHKDPAKYLKYKHLHPKLRGLL